MTSSVAPATEDARGGRPITGTSAAATPERTRQGFVARNDAVGR